MKRDDQTYLKHISDAIGRIETYLDQTDAVDFFDNYLVQDGVIRQLSIIGEAIKSLTEATRNSQPQIPWKSIAGMRDILVHQYFGVDITVIWQTATNDLPHLKVAVQQLLDN